MLMLYNPICKLLKLLLEISFLPILRSLFQSIFTMDNSKTLSIIYITFSSRINADDSFIFQRSPSRYVCFISYIKAIAIAMMTTPSAMQSIFMLLYPLFIDFFQIGMGKSCNVSLAAYRRLQSCTCLELRFCMVLAIV